MRSPFVVPFVLALLGCLHPGEMGGAAGLPGFPLAAPGEAEGPDHEQRLIAFEGETAVIRDRLAGDGRSPRVLELTVDRRGQAIGREVVFGADDSPAAERWAEPPFHPLPLTIAGETLELRLDSGRWEVWLRAAEGAPLETRLAILPRARATRVAGVATGDEVDERGPALAALAWRSEEGGAMVRGITILDLRAGRSAIHQKRGLEARRRSEFEAAAQHFRDAWAADPKDPLAAYNLSCALALLGQRERALTFLWEAARLDGPLIRVLAARDPDLDSLRDHPDYLSIAGPGGRTAQEVDRSR